MPPLLGAEKPVCKETLSAKPCQLLYESFPAALTVRNVNSRIVITPVQKAAMLECFDVFFFLKYLPSERPHLPAPRRAPALGGRTSFHLCRVQKESPM